MEVSSDDGIIDAHFMTTTTDINLLPGSFRFGVADRCS
jgi:hypothetical protein